MGKRSVSSVSWSSRALWLGWDHLPWSFHFAVRAVPFMDDRNLTGGGSRAGFAAPQALGAALHLHLEALKDAVVGERGKVVLVITFEELFANFLPL